MDVVLRSPQPRDDDALRALVEDPEVRQWNPLSRSDPAQWRERMAQDPDGTRTWTVADPGDDRLLGTVSVFKVDRDQGTCEIGYRVLPTERGRGVATAALRLVAAFAFEELGLRRLELYHAVANPGSCRVAERAGVRLEGTLRESYVYGDGTAYDEHLHARLARDPAGEA